MEWSKLSIFGDSPTPRWGHVCAVVTTFSTKQQQYKERILIHGGQSMIGIYDDLYVLTLGNLLYALHSILHLAIQILHKKCLLKVIISQPNNE
jgi:hypothetical protein